MIIVLRESQISGAVCVRFPQGMHPCYPLCTGLGGPQSKHEFVFTESLSLSGT